MNKLIKPSPPAILTAVMQYFMLRVSFPLLASVFALSTPLLFSSGCAGAPHWDRGNITLEPYQPLPRPDADTALVVFYRPAIGDPSLYAFPILDDQKVIGQYFRGTYFYYKTTPGEHAFWMNWAGMKHYLTKNLEAGKTYYIQVFVEFTEVGESLALPEIRKLNYITAKSETLKQSLTGEKR